MAFFFTCLPTSALLAFQHLDTSSLNKELGTDHSCTPSSWDRLGVCSGQAFQVVLVVKNSPANCQCRLEIGDMGLNPGLGRSPEGGHGNPLQYSCLEDIMERGAWQAAIHRVTQSWT